MVHCSPLCLWIKFEEINSEPGMGGPDFQYPPSKEKHLCHFRRWRWTACHKKKKGEKVLFIIKRSPIRESMLGFFIPTVCW